MQLSIQYMQLSIQIQLSESNNVEQTAWAQKVVVFLANTFAIITMLFSIQTLYLGRLSCF